MDPQNASDYSFPKRQISDSSKLKEFEDDNFKFDENGRWETLWETEKFLNMSNFSFSHCVFRRLVLHRHKNQGLFGNELNN